MDDRPTTAGPAAATGLVAVFPTEDDAREVAREAVRLGVPADQVKVGDPEAHHRALQGEMREEVGESWTSPQAGVTYPKESAKGLAVGVVGGALVGAAIALPFALFTFADLAWWGRVIIMVGVGVAFGGTIGAVVGPSLAVKRPNEPLAAERGVVVQVSPASDEVEEMMASREPIRLDRYHGADITVVTTEDRSEGASGLIDELDRNTADPLRETDPGYLPEDEPHERAEGADR